LIYKAATSGFFYSIVPFLATIYYFGIAINQFMNYWLVKTEPGTYSWEDLVKDKKTTWDGVRNFQARNNLKAMKKGDLAFIYHSGDDKAVIGISKVLKEAYADPKDKDWVVVDLAIDKKLKNPVTLTQVKATKKLADMVLVRVSRLSVQPVKPEEFDLILSLSEGK
jgi:predicted RNA-binding protein with PUA-like domain